MVGSRSEVLELLRGFSRVCVERGWKAAEDGSWVKTGDEYNVIILSDSFTAPTIKSLVSNRRCSVLEDEVWGVREVKHMAFMATKGFPRDVPKLFEENPELASRVALFDLERSVRMGRLSGVFKHLEECLQAQCGKKFRARSLGVRRVTEPA